MADGFKLDWSLLEKSDSSKVKRSRSLWERFKDSVFESGLRNPFGAESQVRANLKRRGLTDEQINKLERQELDKYTRIREADPVFREDRGLGGDLLHGAVDLAGNIVGGVDPSYVLGPGKTVVQRILAQAGINAGLNAASQGVEVKRGIRDEFSIPEVGINALAGGTLQAAGEGVGRAVSARRIRSGANRENYGTLVNTILQLEGGGTLARPKTSPKGALGPMQVMPGTAKDPGFGIRPWNGRTQEDLARVGRQYAAALNHKYKGDTAKVLAAYNGGPGRVDTLVKKYGDDWLRHMPAESRNYVSSGLRKMGQSTIARADAIDTPNVDNVDDINFDLGARRPDPFEAPENRAVQDDIIRMADDGIDEPNMFGETEGSFTDIPNPILSDDQLGSRYFYSNLILSRKAREALPDDLKPIFDKINRDKNLTYLEANKIDEFLKNNKRPPFVSEASLLDANAVLEKARQRGNLTPPEQELMRRLGYELDEGAGEWAPKYQVDRNYLEDMNDDINLDYDGFPEPTRTSYEEPSRSVPNTKPVPRQGVWNTIKDVFDDEGGAYRDRFNRDTSVPYEQLDDQGKLLKAIRELAPKMGEQRQAYRQERARRFGRVDKLQQEGRGEAGFYAEKSALGGQLPKVEFESFRQNLNQEDIDSLFNRIKFSNSLLTGEKISAQEGLSKLLGAEGASMPTSSEIKYLSRVLDNELIEALLANRPLMEKLWDGFNSAINIPRSIMSSTDLSAPFRQGIMFVGKKEFWKSFGEMFKLIASEKNSKALMEEIRSRPSWEAMKRARLAIVDPHSHFMADREEAFMSDWAEKIPLGGEIIKGSNRAYSGFLNKLRADVFDDLINKYEAAGINVKTDDKKLREIARFINAATGRGSLGKTGNAAAPALAAAFFSPRLIASRVQMLSPTTYIRTDPILRKEAWKSLIAYSTYVGSILGVGSAFLGWDVETDPRSSDFAKLRDGDVRIDPTGGFQSYVRLISQLIAASKVTQSGEEKELGGGFNNPPKGPFDDSLASVIGRFFRSKESPVASFVHNFLEGDNVVGEDFYRTRPVGNVEVNAEIMERFIPMTVGDLVEIAQEEGFSKAMGFAPGALFGFGIQRYEAPEKKKAKIKDEFNLDWNSLNESSAKKDVESETFNLDWSALE